MNELLQHTDLTFDQASEFVDDCNKTSLCFNICLYLVSCVWGMGFSWSSYVAQSTMVRCCENAELMKEKMLAMDLPVPLDLSPTHECFAVATDDVMHFCRNSDIGSGAMAKLDAALAAMGGLKHEGKDVDQVMNGTALGIDLTDGKRFEPNSYKWCGLFAKTLDMLEVGSTTPEALQSLMGIHQWMDLLNRAKLAIYSDVYSFCRLPSANETRALPNTVFDKLLLSLCLAPALFVDLTRPYLPLLTASDASTSFGYGVSVANISASEARVLSRLSEKRGDYVRLTRVDGDGPELPRLGTPHVLNLTQYDFKDVLSVRCRYGTRPSVLETEALVLLVRWVLLRSCSHQSSRIVILIDAKSTLGAAAKGRSSSSAILKVLRKVSALFISSDLNLHLVYVPSGCNLADVPSRGKRRRPLVRRTLHKRNRTRPKSKVQKLWEELEHLLETIEGGESI